jgi:hypothetical protein
MAGRGVWSSARAATVEQRERHDRQRHHPYDRDAPAALQLSPPRTAIRA